MNDRGQPVIHNIAQKLGCIRPHGDIDLPVHSVIPEGEAGMAELARQLEEQQKQKGNGRDKESKDADFSLCNQPERASSFELERSGFEYDCRKAGFGSNPMTLSPQSFTGSTSDFESASPPLEIEAAAMFPSQSPSIPNFPAWSMAKTQPEFGTINPHVLLCTNPEVMMVMGDPTVCCGYGGEPCDYGLARGLN
ncbi:zinc cluster transcription factor [Ilyonectria robusta]